MTVAATKTRLATLETQIAGMKIAYAQAPPTVNMTDMPCAVNLTGPATFKRGGDESSEGNLGAHEVEVQRGYKIIVLGAPYGTGTAGEAERILEPFIDSVNLFFRARPSLGNLPGMQTAFITGDSGVAIVTYQETKYYGVTFDMATTEIEHFDYADLE